MKATLFAVIALLATPAFAFAQENDVRLQDIPDLEVRMKKCLEKYSLELCEKFPKYSGRYWYLSFGSGSLPLPNPATPAAPAEGTPPATGTTAPAATPSGGNTDGFTLLSLGMFESHQGMTLLGGAELSLDQANRIVGVFGGIGVGDSGGIVHIGAILSLWYARLQGGTHTMVTNPGFFIDGGCGESELCRTKYFDFNRLRAMITYRFPFVSAASEDYTKDHEFDGGHTWTLGVGFQF